MGGRKEAAGGSSGKGRRQRISGHRETGKLGQSSGGSGWRGRGYIRAGLAGGRAVGPCRMQELVQKVKGRETWQIFQSGSGEETAGQTAGKGQDWEGVEGGAKEGAFRRDEDGT